MAIAESILFQINSSNYTAPVTTIYKPQAEHSGFITTLRLTVNLKSIASAEFPYIPDDTPPDILQQILEEVALNTPFKEIVLFYKKGNGSWVERAPIRIFNKEPYYDVNLMRFFSDTNTIDVAEDLSLGIQIKGGNVLTPADTVLVWGTVVAEKKNNGNEELSDRISALEALLDVFGAPSANLPGSNGLVPKPPAGGGDFLLRGDRGWENPSKFATPAQITTAINALVGSATPETLNTLQELAAAFGNDPNFAATIINALAQKVTKTGNETISGIKTFQNRILVFDMMLADDPYVVTAANVGKGYIKAAPDFYEDYKLGIDGSVRFRCGAGAEFGYTRQFMAVRGSNGNVQFTSTTPAISTTSAALMATSLGVTGYGYFGGLNANLPTSPGGLPVGSLYRTGNTVNIV